MARLLSVQPNATTISLVTGPGARGSGSNTLADGSEQTFAGLNYALRLSVALPPSQRETTRQQSSWLYALANGANATRWEFYTPEMRTAEDVGQTGYPWTGGDWDGSWEHGTQLVPLAKNATKGQSHVDLSDAFWGYEAEPGDWIGFIPSIFSAHQITEVIAPGTYRIEPPLRSNLTAAEHSATLRPRLALRAVPNAASYGTFNAGYSDGRSVDLVEQFHEYILSNFTGMP